MMYPFIERGTKQAAAVMISAVGMSVIILENYSMHQYQYSERSALWTL